MKHHRRVNKQPIQWKIAGAFLLLLMNLYQLPCRAQDSLLYQPFSYRAHQVELGTVLDSLEKLTGGFFTYHSDLIDEKMKVNLDAENLPLKDILLQILPDSTMDIHVVKRQIIISPPHLIRPNEVMESKINPIKATLKVSGRVIDKVDQKPLGYATVGIKGKPIGTISNNEGEFLLKLASTTPRDTLVISYVGYQNQSFPLAQLNDQSLTVALKRDHISLQEVIIRSNEPLSLLRAALNKVENNYPQSPANLTAFYREAVKKNNHYMIYLEAILNIYKNSYDDSDQLDMVKIFKSRKIHDVNRLDTVSLRLKGGVSGCLLLDIVKTRPEFLQEDNFPLYHYTLVDISSYNDNPTYVIEFEPREWVTEPLLQGRIYLDSRTLAIIRAEFGFAPRFANKLKDRLVLKKNRKVKVKPLQTEYLVSYREINGKYYLNHVLGLLKFRVKHKTKLFASTFATSFEMATTQLDTQHVERFRYREILKPSTVFSKERLTYDPNFWENQNFITPEENISEALKRITSSMQQVAIERKEEEIKIP